MPNLLPLIRTVGATLLFALAAALPAVAQSEAEFSAWCYTTGPKRASDAQKIEGCTAIIAANRESPEKMVQAYSNRGSAWSMTGDHWRAIGDYSEALKLKPGDPMLLVSRCHANAIVGELPAALADCNESLRIMPAVPFVLGTRGLVRLKQSRFDEAIADYDAALKIYARDPISLYGRGVAKRKKGDLAGGDADIAAAKAMRPDIADLLAKWGVTP
jgi:tetratricopeptide (TPR) repeat protein